MSASTPVILFVEDVILVHGSVQPVLDGAGFRMASAASSTEAVALLEQHAEDLCALVTDIDLGGHVNGWDIARLARQVVPNIPVVYATAVSERSFAIEGVSKSLLVSKPYGPEQVLDAINALIDADPRALASA